MIAETMYLSESQIAEMSDVEIRAADCELRWTPWRRDPSGELWFKSVPLQIIGAPEEQFID